MPQGAEKLAQDEDVPVVGDVKIEAAAVGTRFTQALKKVVELFLGEFDGGEHDAARNLAVEPKTNHMFAVLDGEPTGLVEVEDVAGSEGFFGPDDFAGESDLRCASENALGGLLAALHGTVKQADAIESLETGAESLGVGDTLGRQLGEMRCGLIGDGETRRVSQNDGGGVAGRERAQCFEKFVSVHTPKKTAFEVVASSRTRSSPRRRLMACGCACLKFARGARWRFARPSMKKIETDRPRVPWSWAAWMTGPWLALFYIENLNHGGPLTFTIRRFVETPVLIGLLTSANVAFNFAVGAAASYMSDRIWTPWGRRRPFLIVGWVGAGLTMFLVPFAPNVWTLVAVVLALQFFADVAKPVEPLYNEVVPPAQRGRAGTMRNIGQQLMGLFFFGVLVTQFDAVHEFTLGGKAWRLSGETVVFWTGGLLTLGMAVFLALGVRENRPTVQEPRRDWGVRMFVSDVFGQRQWWMVYLLYSTPLVAGLTGGSFTVLMQTEQLGFSKAEMGFAVSVGMIVMVVLFAPLAGYLTDRMSRMRLLRIGIVGPTLVELIFFLHVRFVADYSIPLSTWIAYGLAASAEDLRVSGVGRAGVRLYPA